MDEQHKNLAFLQQAQVNRMLDVQLHATEVNRLTVVYRAVLERGGSDPTAINCQFDAPVENNVQPYIRELVIPPEWTPIEFGHVPKGVAGPIIIYNRTGVRLMQVPTEAEIKAMSRQNVFFSTNQKDKLIIRPKRMLPIEIHEVEGLWLCAETIPVNVTISILPR